MSKGDTIPERCPECESVHLFWGCTQTNRGEALDGRLRLSEVGTVFFLGCEVCSETVATMNGDEAAELLTRMQVGEGSTDE